MKLFQLAIFLFSLLIGVNANAQTATISGRVENEAGKAMPGVSVSILGKAGTLFLLKEAQLVCLVLENQ